MSVVATTTTSDTRLDARLRLSACCFAVAVIVHNFDHVRRGADGINLDVFWAGTLSLVVEVGVVVLVLMRHRWAPLAAAVIGLSLAAGYTFVHFTPDHGWLSDSLLSTSHAVSIVAASLEAITALWLGIVGVQIVRRDGLAAAARTDRGAEVPLAEALRHPAVLALLIGNAVVLIVSFIQLG
jgi:hypothetical protein